MGSSFPASDPRTDEASYNRESVLYAHNLGLPQPAWYKKSHDVQYRFAVNVWAGIIGDYVLKFTCSNTE
ncbi:hypothetical protein TNCV_111581 [Trichonephila clavipes]|nr:hypothetical protein TNCV_111581 [Trichonephila clavipes]